MLHPAVDPAAEQALKHLPSLCRRHGTVSRRLAPAVSHLEQSMQLLSSHLDQVVFRETWRVVAAAANRMLYNDVSIQAVFSQEVSLSEYGTPF